MGILGNEAADAVAKKAAEGLRTLEDHEKWMSWGGVRQWAKQRKRAYLEGRQLSAERWVGGGRR